MEGEGRAGGRGRVATPSKKNPPKKIRGLGGFRGLVYILMSSQVPGTHVEAAAA